MKNLLLFTIAFLCVGFLSANAAAQTKVKNNDLKNLAGNFEGTLEYLDYQNDKSKVILKFRSVNTVKHGKVLQETVFTEPNGKEVKGTSAFSISPDGGKFLEDEKQWTIVKNIYDKKSKTRTIVYETKWTDNNRNADLRETFVIGQDQFSLTKEVRYENTTDYFVRNTKRFTRRK